MSDKLRSSYGEIAQDYLDKKNRPWGDFVEFLEQEPPSMVDIVIDAGAANGRNLHIVTASHPVAVDLSYQLLRGYMGPPYGSRVAGSLPFLPFRRDIADIVLLIAVLHHFRNHEQATEALRETNRVMQEGILYVSVWRKWRKQIKDQILAAMARGDSIYDLINHERPWYGSDGSVLATRFYHYYTFRELFDQLRNSNFAITRYSYSGGKDGDANIFVEAVPEYF